MVEIYNFPQHFSNKVRLTFILIILTWNFENDENQFFNLDKVFEVIMGSLEITMLILFKKFRLIKN